MSKVCKNCENARRACNQNVIFCAYWYQQCGQDAHRIMELGDFDTLHIGWGYPRRAVDDVEGKELGAGLMWNEVVLMPKESSCRYYYDRR